MEDHRLGLAAEQETVDTVTVQLAFGRTILAGRGSLAPGPHTLRYRENGSVHWTDTQISEHVA